jgi:hypothetical protein
LNLIKDIGIVLLGFIIGSSINMGFVELGGILIPPPIGADLTTEAGLKSALSLMTPIHFLFPFLGHALGTLFGAWFSTRFTNTKHISAAYAIGIFFLIGGIMMVATVGGPTWFIIVDLTLAYLPMAWLGYRIGKM